MVTCDAASAVCLSSHCDNTPAVGVACSCETAAGDAMDATTCARSPQLIADVPASLEFAFVLFKPARQTAEAVVRNPSEEPSAVLEYRIARAAEVDGFVNVSKAGGVIPPLGQTDLFTVTVDAARLQARHAPYWFTVTILGQGVCACDDMGDITLRGAVYVNAELDANRTVLTLDAASVVAGASVAYSYEPVRPERARRV